MKKTECFFCRQAQEPSYKKIKLLEKYTSNREKILGRSKTGLCQKHQKRVGRAIKKARYLVLLPFVDRP